PAGINAGFSARWRVSENRKPAQRGMAAEMRGSVVAPTLNEAEHIVRTLRRVCEAGEGELIVVDGGSRDGTLDLVRPYAGIVLSAMHGRARQMNAGAQHASGEILLFLHADTVLPQNFLHVLQQALHDPQVVGGRFDIQLDAPGWPFRLIETL